MKTWLSLLCYSNRPADLDRWLDSLYENCEDPKGIELSLTVEEFPSERNFGRWGNVKFTLVKPKQYSINELAEICYKQSESPYIFLSGDDTICKTNAWDLIFKLELEKYDDKIVLVYPNDLMFGKFLALYPVTSREVMDAVPWPVPYKRYAIDDTIFDIVPRSRRIYLEHVVMEHLHYNETGPGHPFMKNGKLVYYPINQEVMAIERPMYNKLQPQRDAIRLGLERKMAAPDSKIMICVPTAEHARLAVFYDYFNALEKPPGTMMTFSHGQSPARNRNIMIKTALEQGATHCMFFDDDLGFDPDIMVRLLAHNVDICSGLYLLRNYPHLPIAFDQAFDDGKCKHMFLEPGMKGLTEVVNIGLGCCLIKTDVFRQMEEPWIRLGDPEKDHWCDDISFFNRARKQGFKLHVDLEVTAWHFISGMIRPRRDEQGNWFTLYNTFSHESFQVPQQIPTKEEIAKAVAELQNA